MTVGPGDVADALGDDRTSLAAGLPALRATTGLYAFHAVAAVWRDLGLRHAGDDRPLYVGKAQSKGGLSGRVLTVHLGARGGGVQRRAPRR